MSNNSGSEIADVHLRIGFVAGAAVAVFVLWIFDQLIW